MMEKDAVQPETQEPSARDGRGRQPKMIAITLPNMHMSDLALALALQGKRMKQTGEDVTRERIFSEALQCYSKALSAQE